MTQKRLYTAYACYAGLAAIAIAVLRGPFQTVLLIFLAGLAVKSWVAYKKEQF